MLLMKLRVATALCLAVGVLAAAAGLLSHHALAAQAAEGKDGAGPPAAKNAEVQRVLDRYRTFRPADRDLAIYQLDWVPTLTEAKEKAAKEQRPIVLIVVTNSYGNMYTGHC
jgi:hypothetical protein